MKRLLILIILILALLTPTSCFFEEEPTPEELALGKELVLAQKEVADVVEKGIELKDKLNNGEISKSEFIKEMLKNEEDNKEAFSALGKVSDALKVARDASKDKGGSWWTIAKGATAGVLGRTILHSAQVALAGQSGGISVFFQMILGIVLGGSKSGREQAKT